MNLVVTGVGMITPVGYGWSGSCAAIRAGVMSARELPGVRVSDGEGGEVPARGCPIRGFAEGFFQAGAWVRLASGALEDLRYPTFPSFSSGEFWQQTGLIALTPVFDPDRFMWAIHERPDALSRFFTGPLLKLLGWSIPPARIEGRASGHAGLGEALQRADALVGSNQVARVVIVGADSYLDGFSLEWLARHGRLKSAERPTGVMPGQSGACLLVESGLMARRRNAPSGGSIAAVAVKTPPEGGLRNVAGLGRLLAEAVSEVLVAGGAKRPFRGEVVLDLNGEEWKARMWGHAQVLLTQQVDFSGCRILLPCESLGEVGAASGLLAVGLVVSGFLEPGASHEESLVCSISDSGQVAVVLMRGEKREPRSRARS